jgi:hypothetical protein
MSKLIGPRALALAIGGLLALAPGAFASGAPQGPPAGPTTPPFFQCPAIGLDTTCQFLVDVTNSGITVLQDSSQGYYDGNDDTTVAVQNDSSAPLGSVHLGVANSGDGAFAFDGDGLCNPGSGPSPDECPFGPPGNNSSPFDYFGPDTVLEPDSASTDDGTVVFPTPLQPGQYTYLSLEAPPGVPYLAAGNVNDVVTSTLTDTENTEVIPSPVIAVPAPAAVTDTAAIHGPNALEASGKVTYKVYTDPKCTKLAAEQGGEKTVTSGVAEPSNLVGKGLATNARYYWVVEYSGNEGEHPNSKTTSACGNEVMTFGTPPALPAPAIVTVLSGGGQVGAQITVPSGTAVTDNATVTAPGGQPVSGRLSYEVYTDPHCAPISQLKGAGGGLTTGTGPASAALTLAAGTYYFQAAYSGNGVLAPAVSPCGSEVLTVSPPQPPPPNNQFTSVGTPQVNPKTGQLVVIGQFPAAGTVTATGVVQHGATLARVEPIASIARHGSHGCRHGFVRKGHRCVSNAPVVYGTAVLHIATPGTYSIIINPTPAVLQALRAGKKLSVVVSTTFQNAAGGQAVTHVQSVKVKLGKRRHHRRH